MPVDEFLDINFHQSRLFTLSTVQQFIGDIRYPPSVIRCLLAASVSVDKSFMSSVKQTFDPAPPDFAFAFVHFTALLINGKQQN